MSEEKLKKAKFICTLVCILSAMLLLIICAIGALRGLARGYASWGALPVYIHMTAVLYTVLILSVLISIGIRWKLKSQEENKKEDRIKILEQEVEKLKNSRK